jgi:hypothetical protein
MRILLPILAAALILAGCASNDHAGTTHPGTTHGPGDTVTHGTTHAGGSMTMQCEAWIDHMPGPGTQKRDLRMQWTVSPPDGWKSGRLMDVQVHYDGQTWAPDVVRQTDQGDLWVWSARDGPSWPVGKQVHSIGNLVDGDRQQAYQCTATIQAVY